MTKTRWKLGESVILAAVFFAVPLHAVSASLCSSQNTGLGSQSSNSIYMSNGQCQNNCAGYAFAITQWQNCWCSNEAPGATTSTSDCSQHCPGYPAELCGNQQQGLYGYVALGKAPQGTMGAGGAGAGGGQTGGGSGGGMSPSVAPSSSPPQTVVQVSTQVATQVATQVQTFVPPPSSVPPPPASTVPPVTIIQTQQNTETQINTVPTIIPTIIPTTVEQDSSTTVLQGPTSTISSVNIVTPEPIIVTSAQAITIGGSIVTNFVTSTPSITPNPSPAYQMPKASKTGLSSGAIAGVVVASILAAAALIVALVTLLFWRRRRSGPRDSEGAPKRNASVLSRVGLLRSSNNSTDEAHHQAPTLPQIRTSGIPIVENGPESALTIGSSQMSENRRFSRPLFSDNRLNPNALMTNTNISRTSVSTLQDNQDYSRPLEVRNPDH